MTVWGLIMASSASSIGVANEAWQRDGSSCVSTQLKQKLESEAYSKLWLSIDAEQTYVGQALLRAPEKVQIENLDLTQGRFNLFKQPFYDEKSLYIGVANRKKEGSHHYYLVAGKKRYDGVVLGKSKVKTFGEYAALSQGVLFKINVSDEVLEKVIQSIEEHKRSMTLTCLHGACSVLEDAGIKIPYTDGLFIELKPAIAGILDGNIAVDGKTLGPDHVQMIATSRDQLEHFLEMSEIAEESQKYQLLLIGGTGVGVLTTLGGLGYVAFEAHVLKEDPLKQ
jgi:hypothetical protein